MEAAIIVFMSLSWTTFMHFDNRGLFFGESEMCCLFPLTISIDPFDGWQFPATIQEFSLGKI